MMIASSQHSYSLVSSLYSVWERWHIQMISNFMTLEKSPNATLFDFPTHPFNFFCLAIRLTDFLKAIELLYKRITAFLTLTNSSPPTFAFERKNTLSALPTGLQAKASYQHTLSLSNTYVSFSIQTLPDNLCKLEAPHHLQKMGFPLQSFKPLADGHPMPSNFTYIRKNPVLNEALLFRQAAHVQSSFIHALKSWPVFTDFSQNFYIFSQINFIITDSSWIV